MFSRRTNPAFIAVAVVTLSRASLMQKRRLILHKERSHIFHCSGMLDNDPESEELIGKKQ
jgi:hypothetical protein